MAIDQATAPSGIRRYIPILSWLPRYEAGWLRYDLLAGLVAAAVVIPQAMAYASIAGLPVQVGLYVALAPMVVYALLGTSRPLSVSSTSTISMLVATELSLVAGRAQPEAYIIPAATLAFLVGLFLVLASFLRLGFLANFISLPVLTGFKAGIGVVILVGQLGKVLGLSIEKGPVFQTLLSVLRSLGQIHWPTLAVALGTLAILLFLPRLSRRIPAALAAVGLAILAAALFNLEVNGVELVGAIPSGLPRLSLPDWSLLEALWPGALGIALMSFVESIASARAFAGHDDPPVDADQELLALGLANIAGAFSQAYPAGGGTSQTAVNDQAGARSQIAQLVTAGVAAVTLLFLAPLIGLMPQATLGALVLVAAAGLIKIPEFSKIARFRRVELTWALVAFAGVMVLGTLQGILVAVVVSLVMLIHQANHPPVYAVGRKPGTDVFRPLSEDHPEDETWPGLLLVRTEGRMHFASAPRTRESLKALIDQSVARVLVLDCSAIPDIEYTAVQLLAGFEERLREAGITLWLAALNPEPLRIIQRAPLGEILGGERMFPNLEQAVEAYLASLRKGENLER
ncbi:MAG: SulP family inorganic anion transporter [Anaerolineae bacterium]